MACCLAVAFLIAVSRTAWRRALRIPDPEVVFPPAASRPGPGGAMAPCGAGTLAARTGPHLAGPARRGGSLVGVAAASALFFFAVGAAVYAGALVALLATGAAQESPSPAVGWGVRHLVVIALAAAALVAERLLARGREPLEPGQRAASALVGIGAAWLVLGVADQHLFGLFHVGGGAFAWDVVFHGGGTLAIIAGWALLAVRPASSPAREAASR